MHIQMIMINTKQEKHTNLQQKLRNSGHDLFFFEVLFLLSLKSQILLLLRRLIAKTYFKIFSYMILTNKLLLLLLIKRREYHINIKSKSSSLLVKSKLLCV